MRPRVRTGHPDLGAWRGVDYHPPRRFVAIDATTQSVAYRGVEWEDGTCWVRDSRTGSCLILPFVGVEILDGLAIDYLDQPHEVATVNLDATSERPTTNPKREREEWLRGQLQQAEEAQREAIRDGRGQAAVRYGRFALKLLDKLDAIRVVVPLPGTRA